MGIPTIRASARRTRSAIAEFFLGTHARTLHLGDVRLAPHQIEAIDRIEAAFAEFGGAFLCDAVGSGKTFIGLGVAARMRCPLIVAPAGLREMWKAAMRSTSVTARFISTESLGYGAPSDMSCDGIVVDEAHHFRNRATKRYRHLCALVAQKPILLQSATPIHNSRRDFDNLASIFLGDRAAHLSKQAMSRLVIRRSKTRIASSARIPRVHPTEWVAVPDDPVIAHAILTLPPAVPFRTSGEARTLVTHGLIRQWASSESALLSALKRRMTRAATLGTALQAGDYPSELELRSWIVGDDAIQLGLPGLFSISSRIDPTLLLSAITAHSSALRELARSMAEPRLLDDEKANLIQMIATRYPDSKIVAFASYESTVTAMFARLLRTSRVAALTSHGGRVAGGRVTRSEITGQFDSTSRETKESDRIDLLLTTDLLSEGVNLQRAGIVIHLDIPWTSARMDQRVGRSARIGSLHDSVRVFGFRAPASAERVIRSSSVVVAKWLAATETIGSEQDHGLQATPGRIKSAPADSHETLRSLLEGFLDDVGGAKHSEMIVGTVAAPASAFIAAVECDGKRLLIRGNSEGVTDAEEELLSALRSSLGGDAAINDSILSESLSAIESWMATCESARAAGVGDLEFLSQRRRVLARIDSIASKTPPHLRFERSSLLHRARLSATSSLDSNSTASLVALATDPHSDDSNAWLENVAALKPRSRVDIEPKRSSYRVHAILLMSNSTPPPSS